MEKKMKMTKSRYTIHILMKKKKLEFHLKVKTANILNMHP